MNASNLKYTLSIKITREVNSMNTGLSNMTKYTMIDVISHFMRNNTPWTDDKYSIGEDDMGWRIIQFKGTTLAKLSPDKKTLFLYIEWKNGTAYDLHLISKLRLICRHTFFDLHFHHGKLYLTDRNNNCRVYTLQRHSNSFITFYKIDVNTWRV